MGQSIDDYARGSQTMPPVDEDVASSGVIVAYVFE
jgi:hypothetical protein